jgi:hypothetical protein
MTSNKSRSKFQLHPVFYVLLIVGILSAASCSDDPEEPTVFSIPPIEFSTPDSTVDSSVSTTSLSDAQMRFEGAKKVNDLLHAELASFLRKSINSEFGNPSETAAIRFFSGEIPGSADPSRDDIDHVDLNLTLTRVSASPHVFRGVLAYQSIKHDGTPLNGGALSGAVEVQVDQGVTTLSYAVDGRVVGYPDSWVKQSLEYSFPEKSGAMLADWDAGGPSCSGGWTRGRGASYEFWEFEEGEGATYAIVRNPDGFAVLEDTTREYPPGSVSYYQLTSNGTDAGGAPDADSQIRLDEINTILDAEYVRTNNNLIFEKMTLNGPDMDELFAFHAEHATW